MVGAVEFDYFFLHNTSWCPAKDQLFCHFCTIYLPLCSDLNLSFLAPTVLQVRAAEALSKLVSELKEYIILNDFSAINTTITQRSKELQLSQQKAMEETQRLYDTYKQHQLLVAKQSSTP